MPACEQTMLPPPLRSAVLHGCLLLLTGLAPLRAVETGATWYVAVSGDDGASGTLAAPFASVQRAQQAANPGDTIEIRGGTYRMQESQIARRQGIFARCILLDKDGTREKPIIYRAYQSEQPVFDFSTVKPANLRVHAFSISGDWLRVAGLTVTGVQVTLTGHTQSIAFESNGSHNVFERLRIHDGMAIGIYHVRGSDNLFLNCDAWSNHDPVSGDGKGGNVDGFGCHPTKGSTNNVFRGCRAWFNSDDGFDCINAHESVVFDRCWAFNNGTNARGDRLADGNGFKAGGYGSTPAERLPSPVPRHVVRGCVAVGNRASGFYANHHPGGGDWFNNSAFANGTDYNMLGRLADNRTDVPGTGHRLRNNLSHGSRRPLSNLVPDGNDIDHNAFPPAWPVKDSDFLSLDRAQLLLPRQADGSLPEISLLRPAPMSSLIDAGIPVGLPFTGTRPDIGAGEP
jgi:hypothetical protein